MLEHENIFENLKKFELLKDTNKIVYEFYVYPEEEDLFLKWINILSSVVFRVDVDLNNIHIKRYHDKALFRVKASGMKDDLLRWNSNLHYVASFFRGDYKITYIKSVGEQE